MKLVDQLMRREVVTLRADASVASAIQAMLKHRVGGLPVVENGVVVGIVTARDLLGQALYRLVGDIMTRDVATITPHEPITAAYALMDRRGVGRLPVVQDGRLAGIISRLDILTELGRLSDPLTDLPWPGTLRQRAAELLHGGHEIVIMFVDLNGFRMVNKRFGHVVGDRLITAVGGLLNEMTDPDRDLLCRYAGDEFAIVTTRPVEEAEALAREMLGGMARLDLPELGGFHLTAAIGLAGGRRGSERRDAHAGATVDDLITMASRASSAAKQLQPPILHFHHLEAMEVLEHPVPEEESRLRVAGTTLSLEGERARAVVELERDDQRYTGQAEGSAAGHGTLRVLAQATVEALRTVLPPGWGMEIEEIAFTAFPLGDAVSVAMTLVTPTAHEALLGSAPYHRNRQDAVVGATLKAVNRRLTRLMTPPG